jgi:quercetin dioxygenase-like cupin family protein
MRRIAVILVLIAMGGTMQAEKTATVETLAKTTTSWNGATLPHYPTGQPEVTILRITIPAGARLAVHEHPVINAGVLTKGSLTVVCQDGKRLVLQAGDPIVEVVNTWHYGMNEGREDAEIIVFYAGQLDEPITVIQGAENE